MWSYRLGKSVVLEKYSIRTKSFAVIRTRPTSKMLMLHSDDLYETRNRYVPQRDNHDVIIADYVQIRMTKSSTGKVAMQMSLAIMRLFVQRPSCILAIRIESIITVRMNVSRKPLHQIFVLEEVISLTQYVATRMEPVVCIISLGRT